MTATKSQEEHLAVHKKVEELFRHGYGPYAMAGDPEKAIKVMTTSGAVAGRVLGDYSPVTPKATVQKSMKERYKEQGRAYRKALWEKRFSKFKKLFSRG